MVFLRKPWQPEQCCSPNPCHRKLNRSYPRPFHTLDPPPVVVSATAMLVQPQPSPLPPDSVKLGCPGWGVRPAVWVVRRDGERQLSRLAE
ncbi:hypothetical protein BDB00DRAFT_853120 [Zychaea mexicana]|uniref:uncharacterized protein n=1 Tax=Zychaea mexicana TaxID=64656 RepID=UPI0022FE7946|nr:uncharacterized protein BDB00DRAFT_853120 [Zychaea mexicana]KAI9484824.1 hypothetical protein BDB00DRAFT_853120 [Zychaea mexicana]